MENRGISNITYRPEVDGLRAIAVLSVIIFHAWPNYCSGGYAGVDVFFVISGFLISGHICSELESHSFSFKSFYGRRIRRIFPALIPIFVFVWLVSWFFLSASEFKQVGAQIFAGTGFASNLLFWKQSGYFDSIAEQKPLLHLWSLAIEEQFYIFWPLLLFLTARKGRAFHWPIFFLLTISFVWNLILVRYQQSAAFYLPMTRIWELLLGALLVWAKSKNKLPSVFPDLQAALGLGFIFLSIILLNDHRVYRGTWAVLPTLGACLVIGAGQKSRLNRTMLSHRGLVFIGLVSYPLYLWHWPLLSLQKTLLSAPFDEPTYAIALTFILGILSYYFVEKPLRFAKNKTTPLCLAMAAMGLLGGITWMSNGVPSRLGPTLNDLMSDYATAPAYRYKQCFLDTLTQKVSDFSSDCIERNGNAPMVFLWGDSHAAHLYPGLRALQTQSYFRLAQLTATSCPPLLDGDTTNNGSCAEILDFTKAQIQQLKPNAVILASRWSRDENQIEEKIQNTTLFLKQLSPMRIYLVGPPPPWSPSLKIILRKSFLKEGEVMERIPNLGKAFQEAKRMEKKLRALAAKYQITYLSIIDELCNAKGCLTKVGARFPDDLISSDSDHLTAASSKYVVQHFFPNSTLP